MNIEPILGETWTILRIVGNRENSQKLSFELQFRENFLWIHVWCNVTHDKGQGYSIMESVKNFLTAKKFS